MNRAEKIYNKKISTVNNLLKPFKTWYNSTTMKVFKKKSHTCFLAQSTRTMLVIWMTSTHIPRQFQTRKFSSIRTVWLELSSSGLGNHYRTGQLARSETGWLADDFFLLEIDQLCPCPLSKSGKATWEKWYVLDKCIA